MSQKTILLAEDDASIRLVVNQTLVTEGYQVRATSSADALERWIRNGEGDVVVTDVYLGDTAIFELLPSIKLARPELPVIVMSGQNTILTAASAARHGVFDYLPKPFDIDQLSSLVGRALKGPVKKDAASASSDVEGNLPLIGRSDPMQEVYRIISRVMNTDLTVLIEGESGTVERTESSRRSILLPCRPIRSAATCSALKPSRALPSTRKRRCILMKLVTCQPKPRHSL